MAANDPIGSEGPRGKSNEQRKHREDGKTWTGTERTIKDKLMRQFMKNHEGTVNTVAWQNSPVWCEDCGMYMKVSGKRVCKKCLVDE